MKGIRFVSASLKSKIRDLLPSRYQVPAKYLFGWCRGTLEEEMNLLPLIVRRHDRAIDVGGNRGVYTYRLWKLGAKVEVFEPNPVCHEVLSAWAAGKPTVHLHSVALSSAEGSANLHIPIDESGVEHDASASIENIGFPQSRDQLVPLRTLDSYEFEDVRLIKIDVEGHEYAVIEGAAATLASSQPALLIEVEQRHNNRQVSEVFEKTLKFGYKGFFLQENELAPLENFDVSRHQSMENFGESEEPYINNFLFLHQDRLADGEYDELMANY
jgi:FkbM family methyltransferase